MEKEPLPGMGTLPVGPWAVRSEGPVGGPRAGPHRGYSGEDLKEERTPCGGEVGGVAHSQATAPGLFLSYAPPPPGACSLASSQ